MARKRRPTDPPTGSSDRHCFGSRWTPFGCVAHAAARAGIRLLFNSEPTTIPHYVGDCLVVGRFSLQRGVPLEILSRLAAGDKGLIRRQRLYWTAKKLLKKLGGNLWLSLRHRIIARREKTPSAS